MLHLIFSKTDVMVTVYQWEVLTFNFENNAGLNTQRRTKTHRFSSMLSDHASLTSPLICLLWTPVHCWSDSSSQQ